MPASKQLEWHLRKMFEEKAPEKYKGRIDPFIEFLTRSGDGKPIIERCGLGGNYGRMISKLFLEETSPGEAEEILEKLMRNKIKYEHFSKELEADNVKLWGHL